MTSLSDGDDDAIARFRAAILADEKLQLELAPLIEPDVFVARAIAGAATLGIALDPAVLMPRLSETPPWLLPHVPPRHWLPVAVVAGAEGPMVEWLHFAGAPLSQSFFQDSLQRAAALPFNRTMRCLTPLSALDAIADAPPPDGLIFHMSRCGSTLVAQMLAAIPGHIVVSEPPPLDTVIQLVGRGIVQPLAARAMIAALTRDRFGTTRRRFVKLDCWHMLAHPLLHALYADVPWIYLYRDPVEVLVSQARMPGIHAVPGMVPLDAFGIDAGQGIDQGEYVAWLLDLVGKAALDGVARGGGLLIN